MSRRIEIELTSSRNDGSWTWRAAGAKQPRGVLEGKLLPPGAKSGDVLRVEVEIGIDGIDVIALAPTKTPHKEAERIQLVATRQENFEGVITTLVPKTERRGRERRRAPGTEGTGPSRVRSRGRQEHGSPAAKERAVSVDRTGQRGPDVARTGDLSRRPQKTARPRPARLVPKSVHRDALFESLLPEQRPVAEQLTMGGIPAVRRAIADQQTQDREANRPVISGDAILTLAEQLLPSVREATWLDRAEAANERIDTISLRDLRATVIGAVARTAEAKSILANLRTVLEERIAKLRLKWEQEIAHALEEGRVLQALRLSAKPPEPSTRFPAALVEPLATAAGAALNDSAQPERWIALLEAAAESPIRRSIKPVGIPGDESNTVRQAASAASGRVPALAKLLGLAIPPPPRPMHGSRTPRTARDSAAPSPMSEEKTDTSGHSPSEAEGDVPPSA